MTSSVNITRAEAQERSTIVTAMSYRVHVDMSGRGVDGSPLTDPETNFLSTTTVQFTSKAGRTWIDMIADQMIDGWLDGVQLDPCAHDGTRVHLDLAEGSHQLTLVGLARYSHTGEGLHRFVDPSDGRVYLYTQFETADARRMYACFDQPDQKATFELTVIAPSDWKVYSNSPTPEPTPDEHDPSFGVWSFAPTPRISTYITALVAGEFFVKHGTVTSIKGDIGADFVCRESMAPFLDSDRMHATTQHGFEVYEEAFNTPYPFEKYDQLFLPEYNAGAMENAGCVTIRDEYLFRSRVTESAYATRDNTILHELAHMWFGDLVTMKWWDDLWLNESFAEWAASWSQTEIANRYGGANAWTDFASRRKNWAYTTDQLPTTHPVAADMVDLETVDQYFDGITYSKGASILKQLVAYVGETEFFAGISQYFVEHAWKNTEFKDLLNALEKASGRDLSQFASQWLATSGVNIIRPEYSVDDDGNFTSFIVKQDAVGEQILRTHRLAIGLYDFSDTRLICRESIEVDIADESTEIAQLIGAKRPDIVLLNDRDLSYVKVRLDEHSLTTVRDHLKRVDDPLARAVIWTSLWDTWRDAQLTSSDYLTIILAGLEKENNPTAVLNQLAQAHLCCTSYAPGDQRTPLRTQLTGGLAALLKAAEPGSDRQLALANALISAINTNTGAELLFAWLRGEEIPEGLTIDVDCRWRILTSLARLGQIDASVIDAELEADNTISGVQSAAGAKAALADPEAKAQAWELATADASVPNGTHLAIATNFWKFGQEELLADYADRYVEVLDQIANSSGVWAKRGHIARQTVLRHLWPTPIALADETFTAKILEWMFANKVQGGTAQVLTNCLDETERARHVAQFSAEH